MVTSGLVLTPVFVYKHVPKPHVTSLNTDICIAMANSPVRLPNTCQEVPCTFQTPIMKIQTPLTSGWYSLVTESLLVLGPIEHTAKLASLLRRFDYHFISYNTE